MKLFLLLILSHVLGDVILNRESFALAKRGETLGLRLYGVCLHAGIHGVAAGILLLVFGFPWAGPALLVFLSHGAVDFIRSSAEAARFGTGRLFISKSQIIETLKGGRGPKADPKDFRIWVLINILDQGSHLLFLILIALYYG